MPPRSSPAEIAAQLQQAMSLHQRGQLPEAERLYQAILQQHPLHFDALQLLGVIANQRGQFVEAARLIGQALAVNANHAPSHYNRGLALLALKQPQEALAHFDKAIALRPKYAEALTNRGNALLELKRRDEALASFDRAIAANAGYAEAHNNRSVILLEMERLDEALASADRALAINANNPGALYNRANALRLLKRFDEALADYDRALALTPNYPEAWTNRGLVLVQLRRPEEALASYDRALSLNANSADAQYNRGNALRDMNRLEEALADYDRALALDPNNFEALTNRAHTLVELRQVDKALDSYGRAVEVNSVFAHAHLNAGIARLLTGDFARGWEEFEWRWQGEALASMRRDFGVPQWLGEDLKGKTIFLHAEQGLGDTIQFCRYVPLVAARGARVVLEVQAPLKTLLQTLDGPAKVIVRGDPLPPFDVHCPLMSLPRAFATTLATIPANVPYLTADPARIAAWREKLGAATGPRIGIAWSGNPNLKNDRNRSVAISRFASLSPPLISVQKDLRPDDATWLAAHPEVRHFGDEIRDFTDTAALISLMDLVVTVDTSTAHLAGALAKPVWTLLPFIGVDWRWMLERDDSPWYPTMRLFRQPAAGDWDSVFARVAAELTHERERSSQAAR